MTEEQARQLLKKYLHQCASPDEIKQVEDWYASLHPNGNQISPEDKVVIGKQILTNLNRAMLIKSEHPMMRLYPLMRRIAAVVLLAGASFALWSQFPTVNHKETFTTVSAKVYERKKILLSDGSKILLEPGAKIVYPAHFTAHHRNIRLLEGEAFFEIAHEERRPFTVQISSGLNVRVLGTSFRVRSVALHPEISITVATGKVAVEQGQTMLATLVKGQRLAYNKATRRTITNLNPQKEIVPLAFNGATLKEVIQKLEYIYNIQIQLTDPSITPLKCTANFNSGQQPEDILDILCNLHHIRFQSIEKHKTFKIYK